jgi:integrase
MGKRVKITKSVVDNLPVDSIVWDSECTGLHVRRQKSEAKVYSVFYRSKDGRQRFMKIGRHGAPWTPDGARKQAREILVSVANGEDPAGSRYAGRKASTVAELCADYLAEGAAGRLLKRGKAKRASTLLMDRSNIRNHIVPVLGALKVASVTSDDVERLKDAITAGKTAKHVPGGSGAATRVLGLLGGIFTFAIKRKLRADNPVRGIERAADGQRDRRVSEEEYARLGEALRDLSATIWPPAIAVTHFLAVTGWRRGEALALKWSEVDLVSRVARLSATKTGSSTRPLSHAACDVLRDLPRMGGDLVFSSSRGGDKAMRGAFWYPIARRAGLPPAVTPHTLRHSFASEAGDAGYSELTISVLLGHRKASVTSKYVHGADSVLLAAADHVARRIEERLGFAEPEVEADFTARRA